MTATKGHIRIDLGETLPDQWIDVIDVGLKSQRQVARWQDLSTRSSAGDEAAAQTLISEIVVGWRVLNPETGTELAAPAEASIEDLPLRALKSLFENIQGQVDDLQPKS